VARDKRNLRRARQGGGRVPQGRGRPAVHTRPERCVDPLLGGPEDHGRPPGDHDPVTPEAHAAFTAALLDRLSADADVVGVVLLGSSSGIPPGPDEFSDHDLFVVTRPGAQERFRTDLGWLPDAAEVVLAFRETPHGVKALCATGHLVELAAFDVDELALARVNRYRVALDRADVVTRMERVRAAPRGGPAPPAPPGRPGRSPPVPRGPAD